MSKRHGQCVLCKAPRFLNHAGLCKKCNASPKSMAIHEEVLKHEHEQEELLKKDAAREAAQHEQEVAEAPEEEQPEEKKDNKKE